MLILRKFFKDLFKLFIQLIFKGIYGKILLVSDDEVKACQSVKIVNIDSNEYKVFKIKKARLFTTSVHDSAVIFKNKLIPHSSFQLRIKEGDTNFARNNGHILKII